MKEIKKDNLVLYKIQNSPYSESDMGDASINLTLKLPVEVDPAFSRSMYIDYKGERFYLATTEPQAVKDISGLMYNYTLMFDSERSDLKRRKARDLASLGVDTYISQGLIFSFNANLFEYCRFLQTNLTECFGSRWVIDLNPALIQPNSVRVDVNNAFIWDLLLKTYEYYGVRWRILAAPQAMVIKVGYPADEISHVFEYGSKNGLTKITRENANPMLINRIRGTGGTRNIPVNYFTDRYSESTPDPNPITGSFNFKNLMPKCFRDSVIAKTAFIDYVQDNALVLKNGVTEDGLEPNEDIYPSIEGVEIAGLGRIDEIVCAEKIEFDNIDEAPSPILITGLISEATVPYVYPRNGERVPDSYTKTTDTETGIFTVTENSLSAKLNLTFLDQFENTVLPVAPGFTYSFTALDKSKVTIKGAPSVISAKIQLINSDTNEVVSTELMSNGEANTTRELLYSNLLAGRYKFKVTTTASGAMQYSGRQSSGTTGDSLLQWSTVAKLTNIENSAGGNKQTFDIWVKDIQFDLRDVNPKTGLPKYAGLEDAKISFKSGALAGYEFVILQRNKRFAVEFDDTKSLNGVKSKYRVTLIKSDAELEASGKLIPNTSVHAYPHLGDLTPVYGDKFVILDIDMPHNPYVLSAEQRLQDYLDNQLSQIKVHQPTYTIEFLDRFIAENPEIEKLLRAGNTIPISDTRLVSGMAILYISNVSIDDKGILPKYTVTLTNKITVNGGAVQRIQSQIDALYTGQYQSSQSSELAINNLDSRYVRKSIPDVVYEPIKFKKGVSAKSIETDNFTQGQFGGTGGAIYEDVDGSTVMEVDRLRVRKEAIFNEVVINQIKFQGGIVVYSAANMEVSRIEQIVGGYRLFFDMKGGAIQNQFVEHDIIRCQRFSSTAGESKYYSTIVINIGADFIDVSESLKASTCILSPSTGDQIVQFGHIDDVNRQSIIEVDVLQGGRQTFYQNVNSYDLTNKNYIDIGNIRQSNNSWKNMIRVFGDAYIGDRDMSSYISFNKDTRQVEVKASVQFLAPDGKYAEVGAGIAAAQEEALRLAAIDAKNKADEALRRANENATGEVARINASIAILQSQVDGEVNNWFYPQTPSLASYPVTEWDTVAKKDAHVGDTFTNTQQFVNNATTPNAGKSWRFLKDAGVYSWSQIADSDAVLALQKAGAAQSTADGKCTTFLIQPTIYKKGDIWILAADWNGYKAGEMLNASQDSATFVTGHWTKWVKYTDDTAVNDLKIGGSNLLLGSKTFAYFERYTAPLVTGETYIFSIAAHTNGAYMYVHLYPPNGDWGSDVFPPVDCNSNHKYERIFVAPVSGVYKFRATEIVGELIVDKYPMLELGNKPSSYKEAPEDVQARIDAAKTAADKGISDAKTGNDTLARIADDNWITAQEKPSLVREYQSITGEVAGIRAQADSFGVSLTAYNSVLTALANMVGSNLDNLTTDWSLGAGGGVSLRNAFNNYYLARTGLQNNIVIAARKVGIDAGIKVDGLQIGGRNLWKNGNFKAGLKYVGEPFSSGTIIDVVDDARFGKAMRFSPNLRFNGIVNVGIKTGDPLILTFFAKTSTNAWVSFAGISFDNETSKIMIEHGFSTTSEWKLITIQQLASANQEDGLNAYFYSTGNDANPLQIANIQLEVGNKATNYTETPEDAQARIDSIQIGTRNLIRNSGAEVSKLQASAYPVLMQRGKEYCGAIMAKSDRTVDVQMYFLDNTTGSFGDKVITLTNEYKQYSITGLCPANWNVAQGMIIIYSTNAALPIATKEASVVEGNRPLLSWMEAPEDTQARLDNLKSGGRNFILNSNFIYGETDWNMNFDPAKGEIKPVTARITTNLPIGSTSGIACTTTAPSQGLWNEWKYPLGDYMLSFWVKSSINNTMLVGYELNLQTIAIGTTWQFVKIPFTATVARNLVFYAMSACTYYLTNVMLTGGNMLMDWTPATEDAFRKISETDFIKEIFTNANQATTGGDVRGGSWMTNLLRMRGIDGKVRGGMSGLAGDNVGNWTGGDYEDALNSEASPERVAGIDRKDGSGHRAKGAFRWTTEGIVSMLNGFIGKFSIFKGNIVGRDANEIERIVITTDEIGALTTLTESWAKCISAPFSAHKNGILVEHNTTDHVYSLNFRDVGENELRVDVAFSIPYNTNVIITYPQAEVIWNQEQLDSDYRISQTQVMQLYTSANVLVNNNYTSGTAITLSAGTYKAVLAASFAVELMGIPDSGEYWRNYPFTFQFSNSESVITYRETLEKTVVGRNGLFSYFSNAEFWHFRKGDGLTVKGKTNTPGVLASGACNANGLFIMGWGKYKNNTGADYVGNGVYRIKHTVGHTAYMVQVNTHVAGSFASVAQTRYASYVEITISNAQGRAQSGFDYIITGDNNA